jgi:Cys-rich repeat protein
MMMRSFFWTLSLALLMTLFVACGDDAGVSGACTDDGDCSRGRVCVNEMCTQLSCVGDGDCDTGQICIGSASGQFCSGLECNPDAGLMCDVGDVCEDGLCLKEGTPDTPDVTDDPLCENVTCTEPYVCVSGVCELPASGDCTVDSCATGEFCNPDTSQCEVVPPVQGEACGSCETAEDCPTHYTCQLISTGKACLPPCTSQNDCSTGWTCANEDGGGKACAPSGYKCEGCVINGCAAGETCDTDDGGCHPPTSTCFSCQYDWECGAGAACVKKADGQKVCMDRCGAGIACAQDTTCTLDQDTGIDVCKGACEGAVLPCDDACPDTAPICMNDVCVQCTDDDHCDDGETCDISGFCTSSECSGATPYFWDEQCVQCLEDGHCAEGMLCNTQTHTCGAGGDVCAQCSDPYPACAEVGGEIYCVQCTTDDHCGLGGVCNTATYSCEGGTVTPTDACESDADCDPGLTGFDLGCDTSTGYCYDKDGGCDGITAHCKGGKDCMDLMSLLLGGGGGLPPGGIPGFPGGGSGSTLPGFCECDVPFISDCGSATCLPIGELFGGGSGNYCLSL